MVSRYLDIWLLVGSSPGMDDFYPTPDSGQVGPRLTYVFYPQNYSSIHAK